MPVRCSREGSWAHLVLDRPPLNILDLDTIAQLDASLEALDDSVRGVVLRGEGGRAFSAGVAVEDHAEERLETMLSSFHAVIHKLRALPAITLAVVRGHCLGGGCELATACDLLLTAEEANFGLPEVELGCFPPVAAALYPRRLGTSRTLELLLTGRRFDGRQAAALGLANWAVPETGLDRRLGEILERISSKSAAVQRWIKKAVRHGEAEDFGSALERAERIYRDELAASEDMREGLAAFAEKRPPRWRHR